MRYTLSLSVSSKMAVTMMIFAALRCIEVCRLQDFPSLVSGGDNRVLRTAD